MKDSFVVQHRIACPALRAAVLGTPLVLLPASTFTTLAELLTMVGMPVILLLLSAWKLADTGICSRAGEALDSAARRAAEGTRGGLRTGLSADI